MMQIKWAIIFLFFAQIAYAAKPDESGIGGTGTSKPNINDLIFNRPNIPEIIDVPSVPNIDPPSIPEVIDSIPDTGITSEFSRDDIKAVTPDK